MGRTCSTYGDRGGAYRVLVGKVWGKTPLQILRCIWEDNMKTNPKEIQWDSVKWINLAFDRYKWHGLLNMIMNLWVP
jgi:hypothetical protein